MCSFGMQYRQVVCRQGYEILPNIHCNEATRPPELQACHVWNNTTCPNIRPSSIRESASSFIWDVKQFGEVKIKKMKPALKLIFIYLST